jgi:DNA-binding SARP family transcriptional activator
LPRGSLKQRSLLALLLIEAGRTVSADRIIDELRSDESATDRQNALWVQVSKLRSFLEPDRERRSEGSVLLTRVPGYALNPAADELDAWRRERLVVEARVLVESDPAAASMVLGEGLALWRGRPYEDFVYESFAQAEIARLDELRLEAVELRPEADLRRGLASEVVGELQGLVRQHPLREQVTAHLMVALYRSGRQAEALRAYGDLRSRLAEELGLDPSAALQQLEARILRREPDLDQPTLSADRPGRLAIRGYELREQIGASALGTICRDYQPTVGREVAVTVIGPGLANDASFIRRFQAGAEMVARLEHPNLVPLYDFWREPDGAYLVTRLFHGGTLEEAMRSGGGRDRHGRGYLDGVDAATVEPERRSTSSCTAAPSGTPNDLSADELPTAARLGENLDYLVLPSLDGSPPPVLLGGFTAAAFADRPEVRALMRHFADPRGGWGDEGGTARSGSFIPALAGLGRTDCFDSSDTTRAAAAANVVRVRYCQDVRDALTEGS